MKSKSCLFNKTVFVSNLKRFFPFYIPLLVAELIIVLMVISSKKKKLLDFDEFLTLNTISSVLVFVFAAVTALLVFSYLYSPNKCNALHSFPIGRKTLFVSSCTAGLCLLLIPQILGFAPAIPAIISNRDEVWRMLLTQAATVFGESFIYYSIAVLAAMLAGNIFAGTIIFLILNFVYFGSSIIFIKAVESFGYGIMFSSNADKYLSFLSPLSKIITDKQALVDYTYSGRIVYGYSYYFTLAILFAASILILFITYNAYKKRKLECAGDMVAFKPESLIFSVIVAVLGGSVFSYLLTLLFDSGFDSWIIVYYSVFSILCFFMAQMVLKKSARVFSVKNIVISVLTCAVSLGSVILIANLETNRIPKIDDIESAVISTSYQIELDEKEDIELAEKLQKAIINRKSKKSINEGSKKYETQNWSIYIKYNLKNGKELVRSYFPGNLDDETVELINKLEASNQPKPVFEKLSEKGIKYSIKCCEFSYMKSDDVLYETISKSEEIKQFIDLCNTDINNMVKDYRTVNGIPDSIKSDIYMVTFYCQLSDMKDFEKLYDMGYDMDLFEIPIGDIQYDYGYSDDDIDNGSFRITIGFLMKDSKAVEFIKSHMK